jgi:lysophospholipase L1-like esterase
MTASPKKENRNKIKNRKVFIMALYGSKLEIRRFDKTVQKYLDEPIQKGRILLYGHSLFTRCSIPSVNRWNQNVEEYIFNKDGTPAILNHGFGSSSADDLLYYYDRLVRPYEPRALVLATSGNDYGFGCSVTEIMEAAARVVDYAQAEFPGLPVFFFTSTPTIKHKDQVNIITHLRAEFDEAVEAYCATKENCTAVRLIDQPFYFEKPEDAGNYDLIREDLFATDRTHLNDQGYLLFFDFLRQMLSDLL